MSSSYSNKHIRLLICRLPIQMLSPRHSKLNQSKKFNIELDYHVSIEKQD